MREVRKWHMALTLCWQRVSALQQGDFPFCAISAYQEFC